MLAWLSANLLLRSEASASALAAAACASASSVRTFSTSFFFSQEVKPSNPSSSSTVSTLAMIQVSLGIYAQFLAECNWATPARKALSERPLVLRRMQTAGAGAEGDVHALGVLGDGLRAIPVAGATVDTFLPVERRHTAHAGSNGLAGAKLDTDLGATALAQFGIEKDDMVGIAGGRLDFATEEQRVLMRHQQLAVIGYCRPAAPLHESAVQRYPFNRALLAQLLDGRLGYTDLVVFFQCGNAFVGRDGLAVQRKAAIGQASQRHAHHAADHALLTAVPRFLGHTPFGLDPARAA